MAHSGLGNEDGHHPAGRIPATEQHPVYTVCQGVADASYGIGGGGDRLPRVVRMSDGPRAAGAHPRRWREGGLTHVDLRPKMSAGELPYLLVIEALHDNPLPVCLHCLFVPESLRHQVQAMGYTVDVARRGPDEWRMTVR